MLRNIRQLRHGDTETQHSLKICLPEQQTIVYPTICMSINKTDRSLLKGLTVIDFYVIYFYYNKNPTL